MPLEFHFYCHTQHLQCCKPTLERNFFQETGKWKPNGEKFEGGLNILPNFIIGGSSTSLGEFPYMALLGYKTQGLH